MTSTLWFLQALDAITTSPVFHFAEIPYILSCITSLLYGEEKEEKSLDRLVPNLKS